MIRHIVLFNTKPEASEADVAAVIESAKGTLTRIPGVRNLGISTSFEAVQPPRYRYGLTMEFADDAALRVYLDHPLHQEFRALFYPVRGDFLVTTLREVAG
ncbi:MAG TPA: Dabb family protein [Thermomicrobiales bacterium]|nr:Dabb family protein [Thermomicrobiales bacterium]